MTSYVGFETGGYLDKLENDFNVIARVRPYLSGEQSRNVRYYISDNFLNFWFRFIYKYRSAVEIGNMEYVRQRIESDYETFSGFILEKWFRQSYMETGMYNIVTNYWEKGSKREPGEKNEIDLMAVNEADRRIVIGECKRNEAKINRNSLMGKAAKIASRYKGWTIDYVGLSLNDMIK